MTLFIEALMAISVLSTGLFAGLLMTVVFFFQKALRELSGPQFALVMQRFLAIARTHPLNYAMTLVPGFVPIVTLILLREHPGSGAFVFTVAGLLAFWAGPIRLGSIVGLKTIAVCSNWTMLQPLRSDPS